MKKTLVNDQMIQRVNTRDVKVGWTISDGYEVLGTVRAIRSRHHPEDGTTGILLILTGGSDPECECDPDGQTYRVI